jgi:DNA uptake protein ComE-like DNA-binding protein
MTQIHKLFKMQYKKFPEPAAEVAQAPVTEIPVAQGVSVNEASLEALVAVNGLGEAMAQQIIEGRPWAALEELTRIKGISAKSLERWTELTL